jgi:hypothetical protein
MLGLWRRFFPESDPATLMALSLAGIIGCFLLSKLARRMRSPRWCYGFTECSWVFAFGCMGATVLAVFAHVPAFVAWLAWALVGVVIVALIIAGARSRREARREHAARTKEPTR